MAITMQEAIRRLGPAIDAGLIAGAQVYVNAVKRGLQGGYTTGDFVTGNVINAVTRSEPERGPDGTTIRTGINVGGAAVALQPSEATGETPDLPTVALYGLAWELGHYNLFTRRFERVEVWRPKMVDNRDAIRAAFGRGFQRRFEAGAAA